MSWKAQAVKISSERMKKLVAARRFSQGAFLALFIYILWSTTYPLKGLLPAGTFFRLDPFILIETSIAGRVLVPGLVTSVSMILLTVVFGRFFCGWVCPLGSAIDIAGSFNRKKLLSKDTTNRIVRKFKYLVLGGVTAAALFGLQAAWLFDPIVIMARFVSLNLIPGVTFALNLLFSSFPGVNVYYFPHSAVILVFFLTVAGASLFITRFWCRTICPLGGIYALIAGFSPFKRTVEKCAKCKVCKSNCRMQAIRDDMSYVQGECILCMDCVYDCPGHTTRFKWMFGEGCSARVDFYENIM